MSKYGLGSTFEVGNRWHVRYSQHGRQIREATGILIGADKESSRAKADKFLKRRLIEIESGKFTPRQDKLTLDELLDAFLADQKMKGRKALETTTQVLLHVRDRFKGYRAIDVTAPKLREYVNDRRAKDAAPASIQRELSHLRSALRLAVDDKRLNAVPKFPTLTFDNRRTGYIEPADFERLHAALPAELQDFATFLYWSGWRSNEAKTLQWRDVNVEQSEIRLRSENSKTAQSRSLPLFGAIKELIERRHASRRLDSPFVFSRDDGRPLGQIIRTWKAASQRAGLFWLQQNPKTGELVTKYLTPHDCRRSAIRNLIRAGVPQHVAMSWSGHKTVSVFQRYDIISGSDLAQAADKLTDYVAGEIAKPSKVIPLTRTSTKLAKSAGTTG